MDGLQERLDDLIRRCGNVTERLEFGGAISQDTFAVYIAELAGIVKEMATLGGKSQALDGAGALERAREEGADA